MQVKKKNKKEENKIDNVKNEKKKREQGKCDRDIEGREKKNEKESWRFRKE